MRRLFFFKCAPIFSSREFNEPCLKQNESPMLIPSWKMQTLIHHVTKKKTMLFLKVDTRVSNYIVYTYFIIKMFLNLTRVINLRFQTPHCNQIYRVCYLQVATSSTQWKINFKNKLYIGEKKRYLLKFWIV